ncbi:MAG: TadE family protein [Thermodesulfobacteriota bacterium]
MNAQAARGARRGAVILETAMLMPVFVLLLVACVDFGRVLWLRGAAADAAARGARLAVLHEPTDQQVVDAVLADLAAQTRSLDSVKVTVGTRAPGRPVAVTVQARMDYLVLPGFIPGAAALQDIAASAEMVHEP